MAVPGNGSRTAGLMFIGEGPGHYEDQQGLPFVGRAGQLLNEMLAAIGMRREDVFVTNMIKCRAPNNRDPLPIEIRSCGPYLDRQIELTLAQGDRDARPVLHGEVLPGRADRQAARHSRELERHRCVPDVPSGRRPSELHHPRRPGAGLPQAPEPAGGHAGNRACHAPALRAADYAARTPRRPAASTG